MWIIADDRSEDGMILGIINGHQQFIGHADEGFPVLDVLGCPHADQSPLEVGRILNFWHFDSIGLAPFVKDLTFALMLPFPIICCLFWVGIGHLFRLGRCCLYEVYKLGLKSRLLLLMSL